MTTIELRTEIMRLLREEENTSILEAIRLLLRREEVEVEDISDEEYTAFDEAIARHESGEEPFHTREESMRMIREGRKG
jgi:hypothetical protein